MKYQHNFAYMINDYGIPYTYRPGVSGGYVNGEAIKVEFEPVHSEGIILHLGREDLKYAPNGTYTTEDIKIYDTNEIPIGSIVEWKGKEFKVSEQDLWMDYSDFNVWYCKKVTNK